MYTEEGKKVDVMEFEVEYHTSRWKPNYKNSKYEETTETYTVRACVIAK